MTRIRVTTNFRVHDPAAIRRAEVAANGVAVLRVLRERTGKPVRVLDLLDAQPRDENGHVYVSFAEALDWIRRTARVRIQHFQPTFPSDGHYYVLP